MRGKKAAKIAVSAATYWVDKPFDYRVPEELEPLAVPGARVRVPFGRGNKMCEGIVLACGEDTLERRLKYVERVLDDAPILESSQIKLALWMRERFFCTVYDAVKAMLPAGLWFKTDGSRRVGDKTLEIASLAVPGDEALSAAEERRRRAKQQAYLLELLSGMGEAPSSELCRFAGVSRSSLKALEKEGLITLERKEVFRRPTAPPGDIAPLPDLNADQKQAFDGISALASRDAPAAALLFGVTGSGKTTVYIRLIAELLERGRSTILLVPEISLTPQMIETFSSHFGDEVAVLHSSLGTGERYDEWKRVKAGLARVVIGTRSAVFAPAAGLGAIIIDEEQEETYKSENTPRYNARDVAKWRCAE